MQDRSLIRRTAFDTMFHITLNNNVSDYPVIVPNFGTPWPQGHRLGGTDAIYARLDVSTLVGITELNSFGNTFTIFPNPSDKSVGMITSENLNKGFRIIVYNSSGQILLSNHFDSYSGKKIEIKTDGFTNGIYLAKLILSDGKTLDQKFIIQR